jgi:prolyl-tRNA synthetase
MAENAVFVARRDRPHREKTSIERNRFIAEIPQLLNDIQQTLYDRALSFREENTRQIDDHRAFYDFFTPEDRDKPEIHGGFAMSRWCGSDACEDRIKQDLSVTIRCIPFVQDHETGACICCGKPAQQQVVFAKAY